MAAPNELAVARDLARLYAEAELRIITKIAMLLRAGLDSPEWRLRRLAELRTLLAQARVELNRLNGEAHSTLSTELDKAYGAGAVDALTDLKRLKAINVSAQFRRVNEEAVRALVDSSLQSRQVFTVQVLRSTEDAYRRVIARASEPLVLGEVTRRQAAQTALNEFAAEGVKTFRDASGRTWDMATYAEMATRTSVNNAYRQGSVDRYLENGYDVVIVSGSPAPCPLCDRWEGRRLSLTGQTPGIPTLDEALRAGLGHPNCTHNWTAVSELTRDLERPPKEQRAARFDAEQEQRYIERQIRQWKRVEAAALDDQAGARAGAKVRAWQARARENVSDSGIFRQPARESITRAR